MIKCTKYQPGAKTQTDIIILFQMVKKAFISYTWWKTTQCRGCLLGIGINKRNGEIMIRSKLQLQRTKAKNVENSAGKDRKISAKQAISVL